MTDTDVSIDGETHSDGRVSSVGITLRVRHHMLLGDLVPVLGPYEVVAESKTSSVEFDRSAPNVVAFAHLLSSKAVPNAIVTSVELRRATKGP